MTTPKATQHNKETNARRNKSVKSAHNAQYHLNRPARDRIKKGTYAASLEDMMCPINVEVDSAIVASDLHIPFIDRPLFNKLLDTADAQGIKTLFLSGDTWDCDNYSKFTKLAFLLCFPEEIDHVKSEMKILLDHFEKIYICRGNHEKRWIDVNGGKMGMKELFRLAIPSRYSEDAFDERVQITTDDHMYLYQDDEMWLLCHPQNFRITSLSVVKDLASRYMCNVIGGHGHQFAQGRDRSGRFRVCDGGGLFDKDALEYLRGTTCYPETRSGFYSLIDGKLTPCDGK